MSTVAGVGVVPTAGCGQRPGDTYELRLRENPPAVPAEYSVVNFDDRELTSGQRDVLQTAAQTGTYVEDHVIWSDAPRVTAISDGFKSVLTALCINSPSCESFTTGWDAYLRFDGTQYSADIDVTTPGG